MWTDRRMEVHSGSFVSKQVSRYRYARPDRATLGEKTQGKYAIDVSDKDARFKEEDPISTLLI